MAKKKKKNKKGSKINRKALMKNIVQVFTASPNQSFNYKQVSSQLFFEDKNLRKQVSDLLYELVDQGILSEERPGKFRLKAQSGNIIGTVDMNNDGNAYIISEEMDEDVFVPQRALNHALDGDKVQVYCLYNRKGRRVEGEVVEILERRKTQFVGIVEVLQNYAFLLPETKKMPYDLFIPLGKLNGATNGQKAIGRITSWPREVKNPFGEIVEVLGEPGAHETEMHAILAEFDLPYTFPKDV